jgi:hypothetical protein
MALFLGAPGKLAPALLQRLAAQSVLFVSFLVLDSSPAR